MTSVIDQPVLVLNRHWQPVAVLSVGVAITTVVRGMGWVVEPESYQLLEFEAWCALEPEGGRSRTGDRRAQGVRGSAEAERLFLATEPLPAGRELLSILWSARQRPDHRPRPAPLAGGEDQLGELRARLWALQQPQG